VIYFFPIKLLGNIKSFDIDKKISGFDAVYLIERISKSVDFQRIWLKTINQLPTIAEQN
jgi:hypothetical protein